MVTIQLNLYLVPTKLERISVDSVDLTGNTSQLKYEISKKLAVPSNQLDIIYGGRCMKDEETLASYGVKAGVTLHVLKRADDSDCNMKVSAMMDVDDVAHLCLLLGTPLKRTAYRNIVSNLSKPEYFENIVAATPGLASDPIALGLLQDLDLLVHCADDATFQKIVDKHPTLVEALNHIAADVYSETGALLEQKPTAAPAASLYSLDGLSDDEEMDSSQSDDLGAPGTSSMQDQQVFPGITSAQLASALAAASTSGTNQGNGTLATGDVPSEGTSQSTSRVITPEMFSHAMQQALGNNAQSQLQQLRDMGIMDDVVSLRALEITGGDVQAALELIFGDFVEQEQNTS